MLKKSQFAKLSPRQTFPLYGKLTLHYTANSLWWCLHIVVTIPVLAIMVSREEWSMHKQVDTYLPHTGRWGTVYSNRGISPGNVSCNMQDLAH